jgi:hypothetical protein
MIAQKYRTAVMMVRIVLSFALKDDECIFSMRLDLGLKNTGDG